MEGVIVKGIGGFYYVKTEKKVYECKARGIFRKDGITPCVGDHVTIKPFSDEEAVILAIHPRKNHFIRPPIANVDCFVIVMAAKKPAPNMAILDKFLVMAEFNHTDIVVCINKADLADEANLGLFTEIYGPVYPMAITSGATGMGIDRLKELLKGKVAAVAGPSGVGKSTLLNRMEGQKLAVTGEVSMKSQRGKHTTRHVELFETEGGGMLFDTPGFTSFDILEAKEEELAYLYPEMAPYMGKCYYDNCRHLAEPGCAVHDALERGEIHSSRYASYKTQVNEIREMRKY